jgi:phosphomevalonate kinase
MTENPTKPTQLHLTERLRRELQEQSTKERRSMSSLAEELIALGLNSRRQAIEDRIDQVLHGRG